MIYLNKTEKKEFDKKAKFICKMFEDAFAKDIKEVKQDLKKEIAEVKKDIM